MRKSLLTDDFSVCFFCGRPAECVHHIFAGTGRRKISEREGFIVPLCNRCHNMSDGAVHFNRKLDVRLKRLAQEAYEKNHTREEFIALVGRNYEAD